MLRLLLDQGIVDIGTAGPITVAPCAGVAMLNIRQTNVYRGPNVWARMPAIRFVLDIGDLEERPTNTIPGFTDRLIELIPSLHDHGCSRGYPGGFIPPPGPR